MRYRLNGVFLAVLAALLMTACNPFDEAQSMMDEYVERLGRVLDTEPEFSRPAQTPVFPRRRERVLAMPEARAGAWNAGFSVALTAAICNWLWVKKFHYG